MKHKYKAIIILYITVSLSNLIVTGSKRIFDDEDEEREANKWYYDSMDDKLTQEYAAKIKRQKELEREIDALDRCEPGDEWCRKEKSSYKSEYPERFSKRREDYISDYERYKPTGFTRLPRPKRECSPKACGSSTLNDLPGYPCNCPDKDREATCEVKDCPAHPAKLQTKTIKCTCSENDNVIGDLLMRVCLKFCDKLCKAKQNENAIRMQAAIERVPHDEREFKKGGKRRVLMY